MSARSIVIVHHHDADAPGAIAHALDARGAPVVNVRSHRGDEVPSFDADLRALIVMGGPMSADDDSLHPFLRGEKRLISLAVEASVPVLGVCLGAQLIASALGGGVSRAAALEIGWHDVERDASDSLFDVLPARFTPFHWHGDAIALPPGATRLAHSAVTDVQAFRFGSAYGLQFHLESDAAMVEAMASAFPGDLRQAELAASGLEAQTAEHISAQERLASLLFGRWVETLPP